jgi:serine/threonine protein kinase
VDAKRVLRELRLMRQLRHPCLLSLDACFGGHRRKNTAANSTSTSASGSVNAGSSIRRCASDPDLGGGSGAAAKKGPLDNDDGDGDDDVRRDHLKGPLEDVYLVMAALDTDLHAVVFDQRVKLSDEQAAWIAYQCCAGVAHLHRRGVAHRDLKV